MSIAGIAAREHDRIHDGFDRSRFAGLGNAARLIGIERFDFTPVACTGQQVIEDLRLS
jgi:hypothetical protein